MNVIEIKIEKLEMKEGEGLNKRRRGKRSQEILESKSLYFSYQVIIIGVVKSYYDYVFFYKINFIKISEREVLNL